MTQQSDHERFLVVAGELNELDPTTDRTRLPELFDAGRRLINKDLKPQVWAAFHAIYGTKCQDVDTAAAIDAFEIAIAYFDPETDVEQIAHLHGEAGRLIFATIGGDPATIDRAIAHLEPGATFDPMLARMLAYLYEIRPNGDRHENWRRQTHWLNVHLGTVEVATDPALWARATNELAVAMSEEPSGDYVAAAEARLEAHQRALDVIDTAFGDIWVETNRLVAEGWLYRVAGDHAVNATRSVNHARQAVDSCGPATSVEVHRMALQTLALAISQHPDASPAHAHTDALGLLDEAMLMLDERQTPDAVAAVEKSRALSLLALVEAGDAGAVGPLVTSTARARHLHAGRFPTEARTLWRIEGEAHLAVSDFESASNAFGSALEQGRAELAQSTSRAGRLETIRSLGEVAGLLAHSYVRLGELEAAVAALERGRGLLWNDGTGVVDPEPQLAQLAARHGVLLFGCFAASPGSVIIATDSYLGSVDLPDLDRRALMELQRGPDPARYLGGWLYEYGAQHDDIDRWKASVSNIGAVLGEKLWRPIEVELGRLGVHERTDVVWFHEGGSGVFPLQADRLRYSIRVAPTLASLGHGTEPTAAGLGRTVVVSDPNANLDFEELEVAAIEDAASPDRVQVLRGGAASVAAVTQAFAVADTLHLACHAEFDQSDVWSSALQLASGAGLTLEACLSLLQASDHVPSLIALNACETGVARATSHVEELLGFPSAFIAHGVRVVIASLWPVDDLATALLMSRFYADYAESGNSATALRIAQDWLSSASRRELRTFVKPLRSRQGDVAEVAVRLATNLMAGPQNEAPFSEPYYWAGLVVFGA